MISSIQIMKAMQSAHFLLEKVLALFKYGEQVDETFLNKFLLWIFYNLNLLIF
jgi:hypothetical protein